jgi:hypothetical protein
MPEGVCGLKRLSVSSLPLSSMAYVCFVRNSTEEGKSVYWWDRDRFFAVAGRDCEYNTRVARNHFNSLWNFLDFCRSLCTVWVFEKGKLDLACSWCASQYVVTLPIVHLGCCLRLITPGGNRQRLILGILDLTGCKIFGHFVLINLGI